MWFLIPAVVVAGGGRGAALAQWTQFRGPNGQGRCEACRLPVEWSESRNVAWKTPISGLGHSSPVLLDGQVWLTTALDDGRSLRAVCVRATDGRVLFDVEVFAPAEPVKIDQRNSHATPTPVVEPGRVYVHFGSMGTACLSTATGEVLWRNGELIVDYDSGPANSPILFDGRLIIHFDGADRQFVAAHDAQTGRVVWKTDRSAPYRDDPVLKRAFATPVITSVRGRPQVVSLGADQMQAYDPATGSEIWQVRYAGTSNIPMPLVGRDRLFVCTGFRAPELWEVRPDGTGNATETHVGWRHKRNVPAVASPVLVGNRIYTISEIGVASCLDAESGRQVWLKRLEGNFSASLVSGDGRIYIPSEEGLVTVIEPADEFRVVAANELDGQIKATPALSDGALYVRTSTHLYRINADPK